MAGGVDSTQVLHFDRPLSVFNQVGPGLWERRCTAPLMTFIPERKKSCCDLWKEKERLSGRIGSFSQDVGDVPPAER